MKHACKDCKHSQSGKEFCPDHCMHESCFIQKWHGWQGEVRERVTDWQEKNRDGQCPDFEIRKRCNARLLRAGNDA